MASLGIDGINANQKTWGDSIPSGEKQFLRNGALSGPYINRKRMTAVAGARFLQWIAMDVLVDEKASKEMKQLMERDPRKQRYQRFRIAGGAPKGAKVYSKSGTTSDTFHDAGIVELTDGRQFVLVVLVEGKGMKSSVIRDLSADLSALFGGR